MSDEAGSVALREHVLKEAVRIVDGFPEALKPEIYVVSFRIWRVGQDPRRPYLAIGYNTESEVRRVLEQECSYEGTARWEYAYWLLEGFETVGHVPEDPVGSALHLAEAKAEELWYEDDDTLSEDERDARDDELVAQFDAVCIDTARRLRADGHLERALGRPVPVVVFDMDRPGWEAEATEAANPPEAITEFAEHQAGL
ncbi:hypothetical protein ABZ446_31765 [Streptomyces sp. NPDC005813]|uniref:hypothetical protein n=1 Tax=Streptomyces sp. NPDC005813 TaxID=3155592 RepID=UPI0033EE9ADC